MSITFCCKTSFLQVLKLSKNTSNRLFKARVHSGFAKFLYETEKASDYIIVDEAIATISSIARHLPWSRYYSVIRLLFAQLQRRTDGHPREHHPSIRPDHHQTNIRGGSRRSCLGHGKHHSIYVPVQTSTTPGKTFSIESTSPATR